MSKKRFSMPVTGGSSLLVIFAVLALTIFAILSVSTVTADCRLADKSMEAVKAYYAADCVAEEILSQLRQGKVPEGVTERGGVYSYSCPISDTQQLLVEVRVEGTEYEILCWQSVFADEWESDDSMKVWDGEIPVEE